MEITCGTDIIEIKRIKEAIEELGDKFTQKIYTETEIDYCENKKNQKYQHYAVRFAAKEAVFKAISSKINNKYEIDWKNIEIINDNHGRPNVKIYLKELETLKIDISLSHCKEYAVANVISYWKN